MAALREVGRADEEEAHAQETRPQGKLDLVAKAKLAEYKRKRDPKKTPEPFGGRKRGKQPVFVVQRHDASRLHYDFRLERNGALASWAVPKGVPLEDDDLDRLDRSASRKWSSATRSISPLCARTKACSY